MAKKPTKRGRKRTPPPEPVRRLIDGDKELATNYGVSTRTIQTWRDKGLPHVEIKPRQYQYDLDQTDEWVDAFRKTDETNASAEVNRQLDAAELRIKLATALKRERDLEKDAGNVLLKDEYELHLVERNQRVRDFILSIPPQMRKHLGPNFKKPLAELTKLIDKALNQLADTGQSE